jgi:adenylate kinase
VSEALDLVLMGPPGAGKGTQAQRIAGERGLAHIATGDMLRAAVREGSPLGLRAKGIMARGDLVPDDVIIDMIRERLGRPDTAAGFLLDGFPRTAPQAEALDQMLAGVGRRIARVLVFDLDEELLVERISGRRVCRAAEHVYHIHHKPPRDDSICDLDGSELYQREDDKPEVVRARYQKQWVQAAASVVAYYRSRGLVDDVDAAASPEVVASEVDRLLDRLEAA